MNCLFSRHFLFTTALFAVSLLSLVADEKAFDEIEPILMDFCYDCHGDGMDKGDFAMDEYDSIAKHLQNFDVWFETWKNVRSNLMPPADKKQLSAGRRDKVLAFIESKVFKIDH